MNETPQQICDDINARVDRLKAEARAEQRIRAMLAKSSKQYGVKALSLMTHSRGAVVAVMGSNGKG